MTFNADHIVWLSMFIIEFLSLSCFFLYYFRPILSLRAWLIFLFKFFYVYFLTFLFTFCLFCFGSRWRQTYCLNPEVVSFLLFQPLQKIQKNWYQNPVKYFKNITVPPPYEPPPPPSKNSSNASLLNWKATGLRKSSHNRRQMIWKNAREKKFRENATIDWFWKIESYPVCENEGQTNKRKKPLEDIYQPYIQMWFIIRISNTCFCDCKLADT